jgi:L-2-hydroxyglutarate oxidase LhgO
VVANSPDLAVVGGGIIGLAVAREHAHRHPSLRVAAVERERAVGSICVRPPRLRGDAHDQ